MSRLATDPKAAGLRSSYRTHPEVRRPVRADVGGETSQPANQVSQFGQGVGYLPSFGECFGGVYRRNQQAPEDFVVRFSRMHW